MDVAPIIEPLQKKTSRACDEPTGVNALLRSSKWLVVMRHSRAILSAVLRIRLPEIGGGGEPRPAFRTCGRSLAG